MTFVFTSNTWIYFYCLALHHKFIQNTVSTFSSTTCVHNIPPSYVYSHMLMSSSKVLSVSDKADQQQVKRLLEIFRSVYDWVKSRGRTARQKCDVRRVTGRNLAVESAAGSLRCAQQEVFSQQASGCAGYLHMQYFSCVSHTQHAPQPHGQSEYKCHSGHEEGKDTRVAKLLIWSLGWTERNNNAKIFTYNMCMIQWAIGCKTNNKMYIYITFIGKFVKYTNIHSLLMCYILV